MPVLCKESNRTPYVDNPDKNRLAQKAKDLFYLRGYCNVSFRDIVESAGLTLRQEGEVYFPMKEICHEVIEIYKGEQQALFDEIDQEGNPRQRIICYLDCLSEQAEELAKWGCPITNLYFDFHREGKKLSKHVNELLVLRFEWVREQFIFIIKAENNDEYPERLMSAIHGIAVMAEVTGDVQLVRNQVNQLKSWIRSL